MLQDAYFSGDVIDIIRKQHINAEWALEIVVSRFLSSFEKVEDPYLRERGQDLNHIYQRLLTDNGEGEGIRRRREGHQGERSSSSPPTSPRPIPSSSTSTRYRGS